MTETALQRLLKYPHAAVFDKSPGAELALRLRHAAGATWSIADEVLTASAGGDDWSYDLSEHTVGSLAAALAADGFEVAYLSADFASLGASVLVEGAGDEGASNGDRLTAFTSPLWALFSGYAGEVREAEYSLQQALRQMVITQAEGEWLDLWGTLYGDSRKQGETDAQYAPRIPEEAFRLRVNAHGIEKAIVDGTGFDVRIEEPWKEVFHLDESLLSGPHKFYDGERYGYHLIQPTSRQEVDWAEVNPVIDRNRAAGVIVLAPRVFRSSHIDAGAVVSVSSGALSENTAADRYQDRALLDYNLILSDDFVGIVNHTSRHRTEIMRSSGAVTVPSQTWAGTTWTGVPWSSQYFVHGRHARDYRVYFTTIDYSLPWTPLRTWLTADASWSEFGPIIGAAHTRS